MRHIGAAKALAAALAVCLLAASTARAQTMAAQDPGPAGPDPDSRRTVSRLPGNLWRGVIGVFDRDTVKPLLVGAAATGVAAIFDDRVNESFSQTDSAFAAFGETAGGAAVTGSIVAGLFVAGRLTGAPSFRSATYDMATATIVTEGYDLLIKVAVGRERPDGTSSRTDSSFPSGHTATGFALASVIERHFGWKAGVPAYAFASAIGASRLRGNRHYLSDVVAGATLGLIVGRTSVRMNGGPLPAKARRATVAVSALGEAGLRVAIAF